jgi:predicted protein tyrosine phosphatase
MRSLPIESIRKAVSAGEFGRAQILWDECAARLDEDTSIGCLTEATLSEVRELLEWSRIVVLCERAHVQAQLNRLHADLHVAEEYELPVPSRTCRIVEASF